MHCRWYSRMHDTSNTLSLSGLTAMVKLAGSHGLGGGLAVLLLFWAASVSSCVSSVISGFCFLFVPALVDMKAAFSAGILSVASSHDMRDCPGISFGSDGALSSTGDWCGGMRLSLERGSTFECTTPARCTISSPGYAPNTAPHAARCRFVFSYVLAHCRAAWSVMTMFFLPSTLR